MNALTAIAPTSVSALVRSAASKLAAAETSAEVLDARREATVAYDAAKLAGRMAKAKQAHDEVITAVYRAQADALEIESLAKRRLADEYDAAQERGEAATQGRPKKGSANKPFFDVDANKARDARILDEIAASVQPATISEIDGLTKGEIHEARAIRDAEAADPGVTRRALDEIVDRGEQPTRAALKREIAPRPEPRVSDDALWLWGRLRDFERKGLLSSDPSRLLIDMTPEMRADVQRLAPLIRNLMEEVEMRFVPA